MSLRLALSFLCFRVDVCSFFKSAELLPEKVGLLLDAAYFSESQEVRQVSILITFCLLPLPGYYFHLFLQTKRASGVAAATA